MAVHRAWLFIEGETNDIVNPHCLLWLAVEAGCVGPFLHCCCIHHLYLHDLDLCTQHCPDQHGMLIYPLHLLVHFAS